MNILTKTAAFFVRPIVRIPLLILSIGLYAVTVTAAYGGRFDPDYFTVAPTLTLVLPGLAIATLIVTVLWWVCRGFIGGTLGVLAILAGWGPVSTAIPFGNRQEATPGADTFTVLSWNMIHGWDQEGKSDTANRTIQYILDTDADIVCLQEMEKMADPAEIPHFSERQQSELHAKYPWIVGLYDMKVLSKYPIVRELGYNYVEGDFDPKRYSFYKVDIKGHRLTLINLHLLSFMLTPDERDVVKDMGSADGMRKSINMLRTDIREKLHAGFKKRKKDVGILRRTIDKMKGPMIICGDFNDVPESYSYRLLRGDDLHDAWVETGFGPLVTYNRHAFWVHLDQIFYRGPLRPLSVTKGHTKSSDHYPLLATFEFL